MSRQRLTISLKPELVKLLDEAIDGQQIRNRSHAVEFLLTEKLKTDTAKVLILAGGQPIFQDQRAVLPKALLQFQGRPILQHTLERLKAQGFLDVVLSVGQMGEAIKNYFGDGTKLGLKLSYLEQAQTKLGSASPLQEARGLFYNQDFLLVYGDVLAEVDFAELLRFHRSQKSAVVSMALTSVEQTSLWGVAQLEGSRITTFEEKPKKRSSTSHLVNAGIYVMSPEIFRYLDDKTSWLEKEIFPRLAQEKKIFGYVFQGAWLDAASLIVFRQ